MYLDSHMIEFQVLHDQLNNLALQRGMPYLILVR